MIIDFKSVFKIIERRGAVDFNNLVLVLGLESLEEEEEAYRGLRDLIEDGRIEVHHSAMGVRYYHIPILPKESLVNRIIDTLGDGPQSSAYMAARLGLSRSDVHSTAKDLVADGILYYKDHLYGLT